jgi:glycosyltransferase involved in cell wall biosynthesis
VISVTIATLDRPQMLRRCIESLLVGEDLPEEIVVVDGSDDEATRLVVDGLGSDLVRYARSSPPSISASRNRSVELARGEYVAVVDDDCEMPPGWLREVKRQLELYRNPDGLYGEIRHPDPAVDSKELLVSIYTPARAEEWTYPVEPDRLGFGAHMILKASTFRELGGFDLRLGPGTALQGAEDIDYSYRLLKSGGRAVSTPAIWVIHHQWRTQRDIPRDLYRRNLGHAAFCAKHVRQGDTYPWRLFRIQAVGDVRMLASAGRRRSWTRVRAAFWRAVGTWAGLVRGWRAFAPGG